MTDRASRIPSPEQVAELLREPFARAGYDVEDVTIDTRSNPPRLRIVADGDVPLDLDTVAELSRSASELLDTLGDNTDSDADAYLLEVSSAGVDRPLTTEKHFRRARGRRVELVLADGAALTGRLGAVSDGGVDLVVRDRGGWAVRRVLLAEIGKAVVQVEFSAPNARELELAGMAGTSEIQDESVNQA